MAQIKVLDLDSVCLPSELNTKEARAINGGYATTYAAYRGSGASKATSRRAARDAYNRVIKDLGNNWYTRSLARAASLSTSS